VILFDAAEETMSDPQYDPQTHPDTDPVNDPAHDTDEDEGWESEGGATEDGPATQ
jgi:hypothetical protein